MKCEVQYSWGDLFAALMLLGLLLSVDLIQIFDKGFFWIFSGLHVLVVLLARVLWCMVILYLFLYIWAHFRAVTFDGDHVQVSKSISGLGLENARLSDVVIFKIVWRFYIYKGPKLLVPIFVYGGDNDAALSILEKAAKKK